MPRVPGRPQQPRPQLRGHPGVDSLLDPHGEDGDGADAPALALEGRPGSAAPPFVGLSRQRVRSASSAVGRTSSINALKLTIQPVQEIGQSTSG